MGKTINQPHATAGLCRGKHVQKMNIAGKPQHKNPRKFGQCGVSNLVRNFALWARETIGKANRKPRGKKIQDKGLIHSMGVGFFPANSKMGVFGKIWKTQIFGVFAGNRFEFTNIFSVIGNKHSIYTGVGRASLVTNIIFTGKKSGVIDNKHRKIVGKN